MKYHVHVYELAKKGEVDVDAGNEKDAENKALSMVESGEIQCNEEPESKHIAIAFRADGTLFKDMGDGTILDRKGLTWQKEFVGNLSWEDATSYAQKLKLGGHEDWRLPTLKELESLLDRSKGAFSSSSRFPNMPSRRFWTSDQKSDDWSSSKWIIDFSYGQVEFSNDCVGCSVRCVRKDDMKGDGDDVR